VRWRGVASLVIAVLTALTLSAVPPASSTTKHWSRVAVSLDGHTWTTQLREPLFDKRMRWVPGDERTGRFYVRNRSGERARLTVTAKVDDPAGMLRRGEVHFEAKLGRHWTRINPAGNRQVARTVVKRSATRKVWVRVRMSPRAGNDTMNRRWSFRIQVRLTSLQGR
jgi:hypothetical protein